ncbi:MAG: hypothetical protein LBR12_01425 [Opitutaceae bacterium]|jgi:hypothetical protein|nr:hypothetical protein [Opitutaceae bacterium]
MKPLQQTRAVLVALAALLALVLATSLLPAEDLDVLLSEEGPVETATALLYFAAVGWFAFRLRRRLVALWHWPVIFLAMGCRELDFHTRFTTINCTKLRFFTGDKPPLHEKLLVALVFAGIALAVFRAARAHLPALLRAWRTSRRLPNPAALAAVALVGWSLAADKLPHLLKALGVTHESWLSRFFHSAEEAGELGIPVLILLAIAAAAPEREPPPAGADGNGHASP